MKNYGKVVCPKCGKDLTDEANRDSWGDTILNQGSWICSACKRESNIDAFIGMVLTNKGKPTGCISVSLMENLNEIVDSIVDIPREAFPASLRDRAQVIQADMIGLRVDMISAKDWGTHCVPDIELFKDDQ